ncbi:N-acetylmuramoyl-L-alanine amidase [Shouchella sp. 1P09AA]|uniref:N-acetylmuramoyl-L-alanine amidase n=1 Tax=unclassified Shouchella TaxID=2893065 RepID=UPI0039A08721
MQRTLTIIGTMSIMIFFLILTGEKAEASTNVGVVESDAPLNVRDQPSEQGTIIGKLEPGHQVEYFLTSTDWLKITYAGQVGYVNHAFISDAATQSTSQASTEVKQAVVNSSGGLNVRSGPSSSDSIVGQLSGGTQIDYVERQDGWAQVTFNGTTGFIHMDYLQSSSEASPAPAPPAVNMNSTPGNIRVVLDAGHGGYDPGAVANGIQEKHVAKAYKDQVKRTLEADGIDVVETRTSDEFVSLASRVNQANQAQADLFLSIHANSFADPSVGGFETHYYQSSREATVINREISRLNTGNRMRGTYQSNFQVLRDTAIPAVLIEVGYLTNQADAQLVQTSQHQQEVSEAVRRAVQQLY